MNKFLKIVTVFCALLLTLTLFAACTKEAETTDSPASSAPESAESTPEPLPSLPQGELSVGGQGSLPAFEW